MLIRQLILEQYDTNQNGHLDRPERKQLRSQAREALHQQAALVAAKFDHDQDGKLSPAEREEMRRSLRGRKNPCRADCPPAAPPATSAPPQPRRHHRMGPHEREMAFISHRLMLQTYDRDNSGQLDETEMLACRKDAMALFEQRKAELLSRFDSDHNSYLSAAEYQAALDSLAPPEPPSPHHRKKRRRSPEQAELREILRHLTSPPCSGSTN